MSRDSASTGSPAECLLTRRSRVVSVPTVVSRLRTPLRPPLDSRRRTDGSSPEETLLANALAWSGGGGGRSGGWLVAVLDLLLDGG